MEEGSQHGNAEHTQFQEAYVKHLKKLGGKQNGDDGNTALQHNEVTRAVFDRVDQFLMIFAHNAKRFVLENVIIETLVAAEEVGFHTKDKQADGWNNR